MTERCIAMLGRRDEPTDAIEEYCRYLGRALRAYDVALEIERVNWREAGWAAALSDLRTRAKSWRGEWVLVQYTALAWSLHGFPFRFRKVLRTLRSSGARICVVFHDVEPYPGRRIIDALRRTLQIGAMRGAVQIADAQVFTVPCENLSWLRSVPARSACIPVGANLPAIAESSSHHLQKDILTIAVFGITGGEAGTRETSEIIAAVRFAGQRMQRLRLAVFGRHADLREAALRAGLANLPVELSVEGVLDEHRVVEVLRSCDLLLFVRGAISTRRGSAIAGIACGLPVIAQAGTETAASITEAGVAFYDPQKPGDLGAVLLRVLQDEMYRLELAERSRLAQQQYFSWTAIAARYAELLK
jgi:glycosyltransferase involved in cell wall biosynthesis